MGDKVGADTLYDAAYRTAWGTEGDVIGHLTIRRLDDHEIVLEIPACSEQEARDLITRSEQEITLPAVEFERVWGIGPEHASRPGPPTPIEVPAHLLGGPDDREPDEGEAVHARDDRVRVLPNPADVLAPDQPWLTRALDPLISIELSAIDQTLAGRVHLVNPVEPSSGLIGESTTSHHDEFACTNWICFRFDPDGRYRFLGKRRFFEIEDLEAGARNADPSLPQWYAEAEAEFEGARQEFRSARGRRAERRVVLDQLGGEPGYGNWADFPPPSALRLDNSDLTSPVLRLADGRPFLFVGMTSGYPWRRDGPDGILLFVEPETRLVALTFDWS